ncbi:MAG: 2-oxoacid ferredoxin oxidoreductase [Synergistaceae bacterium]|jgi:2-oxoglutarate ferredoxin oxidoreductase subunit beta|nr:2-oxoacid ferredoxin oxidoreductase [Synergistaceae bacterium]
MTGVSDCGSAVAQILEILQWALVEADLGSGDVVLVSGAGGTVRAADVPDFLKKNFFNAPYGCALPVATGIRASNPRLSVVAAGCCGDMYGAGGNHFLQTIHRNPNIAHIVCHDIACDDKRTRTSSRSWGTGMNPLTVALCCGASFVARGSVGELEFTRTLMKRAILHQGYALLDVLRPNTPDDGKARAWLAENTYKLEDNTDGERLIDHVEAMNLAFEAEPYPLGVLYECKNLPTLEESLTRQNDDRPLFQRTPPLEAIREYMDTL